MASAPSPADFAALPARTRPPQDGQQQDEVYIAFYRHASTRTTVRACRIVTEPGFIRLYNTAGDEVVVFPADAVLCVTRRLADGRRHAAEAEE